MYKLSTLSDSYAGRYPEGISEPSGLQITFGCFWRPSGASGDLRPIPGTFGCFLIPSGVFKLPSACLVLPPRSFGQPPTCETVIPNSSPSRARADSDGPNPRSLYHLQPKNVSLRRRLGEPKVTSLYVSFFYWVAFGNLLDFTVDATLRFYLPI